MNYALYAERKFLKYVGDVELNALRVVGAVADSGSVMKSLSPGPFPETGKRRIRLDSGFRRNDGPSHGATTGDCSYAFMRRGYVPVPSCRGRPLCLPVDSIAGAICACPRITYSPTISINAPFKSGYRK